MKKITLFIVLLSFCFSLFSQTQTHNEDDYSVQYPVNWKFINDDLGLGMIFLISLDSDDRMKSAGVSLMALDAEDSNWSVEKFGEKNLKTLRKSVGNFSLLSSGMKRDNTLNYKEFYEIVYSETTPRGNVVRHKQRYIIKNGLAFVLDLSAIDSNFNNIEGEGTSIMNSYTIK